MSTHKAPFKIADSPAEFAEIIEAQLLLSLRSTLPQAENTSFVLSANDPHDKLLGGLVASTNYGWLLIKCLWVAQEHRNTGLGRALMTSAEDKARAMACHGAWLDTSNPSAMLFYSNLGYTPFGQLANSSTQQLPNHKRWFMSKAL